MQTRSAILRRDSRQRQVAKSHALGACRQRHRPRRWTRHCGQESRPTPHMGKGTNAEGRSSGGTSDGKTCEHSPPIARAGGLGTPADSACARQAPNAGDPQRRGAVCTVKRSAILSRDIHRRQVASTRCPSPTPALLLIAHARVRSPAGTPRPTGDSLERCLKSEECRSANAQRDS